MCCRLFVCDVFPDCFVFFVIPSVDCIATCRFNLESTFTFHRTEQRYNGLTSGLNSPTEYIQECT